MSFTFHKYSGIVLVHLLLQLGWCHCSLVGDFGAPSLIANDTLRRWDNATVRARHQNACRFCVTKNSFLFLCFVHLFLQPFGSAGLAPVACASYTFHQSAVLLPFLALPNQELCLVHGLECRCNPLFSGGGFAFHTRHRSLHRACSRQYFRALNFHLFFFLFPSRPNCDPCIQASCSLLASFSISDSGP